MKDRLDREYFEKLYARSTDPWNFESSPYELRKYERTLDVLRDRGYERALEVGGSIGVFTAMLAPLCGSLLSIDVSSQAAERARERLAGYPNVTVEVRVVPEQMPSGPFDLIVASEVLYYLPEETMLDTLRAFERELVPGGRLLAVHWRQETKTYPLQGDEVHKLLLANTRLERNTTLVEKEYRLDLLEDPT
jgi:protein-L-isoaspartate O-methyltransferase